MVVVVFFFGGGENSIFFSMVGVEFFVTGGGVKFF